MPGIDYAEAVNYLQKAQSTQGTSVYEHLTGVLLKILEERPKDAVDLLEASLLVKQSAFDPKETSPLVPTREKVDDALTRATLKLFGPAEVPINPETGEPEEVEPPNEFECENMLGDAALFEAVGVGIGLQEMYAVMLGAKQLGESPSLGVATVRFFGKVFGREADYYVFEATLSSPSEEEETVAEGEVPPEKGSGTNGYTYFVCNQLGGAFSKLPDVKPSQVKAARQLKRLFTGRLDAPVSAFPPFAGNEANFLRAQIARIVATTVACPASYFTAGEEGALEKNEEYEPAAPLEMAAPGSWCHRYPHLKKQGRCAVFVKEAEGEEEHEPTEEEAEAGPEPLTPLESDAEVDGGAAWSPLLSSANPAVKYQVTGVASALWPGAFAVASGRSFSNIYVGWGIKAAPFLPLPPPLPAKELEPLPAESNELPPPPKPVEDPPAEEGEGEAEEE